MTNNECPFKNICHIVKHNPYICYEVSGRDFEACSYFQRGKNDIENHPIFKENKNSQFIIHDKF